MKSTCLAAGGGKAETATSAARPGRLWLARARTSKNAVRCSPEQGCRRCCTKVQRRMALKDEARTGPGGARRAGVPLIRTADNEYYSWFGALQDKIRSSSKPSEPVPPGSRTAHIPVPKHVQVKPF